MLVDTKKTLVNTSLFLYGKEYDIVKKSFLMNEVRKKAKLRHEKKEENMGSPKIHLELAFLKIVDNEDNSNSNVLAAIEALENKRKPGNPLSKYSKRKELTPMEELEYENMKLRI